jgi:hypothetical protein
MVRRFLFRPRQFFEARSDGMNGGIGAGIAVVFSLVLTSIVGVALWVFSQQLGGDLRTQFWGEVTGALPLVFLGLFVAWLLLSVVLYLGAKLGGGRGTFGATLELTAWGLLPTLVTALAGGTALVVYGLQTDLAVDSLQALGTRVQPLQTGLSGLTILLVQIGVAALQAFIWAAGLRVVHELTRFAAVVTAVLAAVALVIVV